MNTVRVGLATCLEGLDHNGPRPRGPFGIVRDGIAVAVGVFHQDQHGRDEMRLSAGVGPGVWESEVQPWIERLHRREEQDGSSS